MSSRRNIMFGLGAVAATPMVVFSQQRSKVWRIGFLGLRTRSTFAKPDVYYDAFAQGLQELGYIDGKNIVIEWRFADGKADRLPGLAAELVALKPDVIVTHSTIATSVAKRATTSIPIVSATVTDPVGNKIVETLARPGGNVTGLADISLDISAKRLELLKKLVPNVARVAVLSNPSNPAHQSVFDNIRVAAGHFGITVVRVNAKVAEEIEAGFGAMLRERVNALIVNADGLFVGQGAQIARLAIQNRIPSMFAFRENVLDGGLISYGQDLTVSYRKAAAYVDKILKGAKAADLPIEQPTLLHMVINRRTAKSLGIGESEELVLRADEVID